MSNLPHRSNVSMEESAANWACARLADHLWLAGIESEQLTIWRKSEQGMVKAATKPLGFGGSEWPRGKTAVALVAHRGGLLCIVGSEAHSWWTKVELNQQVSVGEWNVGPTLWNGYQYVALGGCAADAVHMMALCATGKADEFLLVHFVFSPSTQQWYRLGQLCIAFPLELWVGDARTPLMLKHAQNLDFNVAVSEAVLQIELTAELRWMSLEYRVVRGTEGWPRGGWRAGRWSVRKADDFANDSPAQLVEELQRLVQAYDELQEQAERQEAENEELRAKCRKLQEQVKRERTAKTRMRNSLRSAVLEREEVASKLHEAEERLGAVLQELSELRANDASPEKSEKRQPPLDELWQRIAEWVRGS